WAATTSSGPGLPPTPPAPPSAATDPRTLRSILPRSPVSGFPATPRVASTDPTVEQPDMADTVPTAANRHTGPGTCAGSLAFRAPRPRTLRRMAIGILAWASLALAPPAPRAPTRWA